MTSQRHARRLGIALSLVLGYAVAEVVAAISTGSLSLLSDAGHMGTDALGLGMSLAAILTAARMAQRRRQTYGLHRLEILAAMANALLLVAIAGYAIYEGVTRLADPPDIEAGVMLWVALGGLGINLVSVWLLSGSARESLNVEGAYLEVLADLWGSLGVIAAAVIHLTTGWPWADPIVAVVIGLWILPRALRLGWKAGTILVQSAPDRIDLDEVRRDLSTVTGVLDVHDLHVWTLTSNMEVASAHLVVSDGADAHVVLDAASDRMRTGWGISHATIQVEPESHSECVEETW